MQLTRTLATVVVNGVTAEVGEAPLWDSRHDALVWVDLPVGRVHLLPVAGEPKTYDVGSYVGAALPSSRGGWLLADAVGFRELAESGKLTTVLSVHGDQPMLRFNDAKCDPAGRAWAGSMAYDKAAGAGTLYRLDPGPVATPVRRGLTVSNGLGWSPDGRTMWFADSANPWVEVFDYDLDSGAIVSGRPRAVIHLPDGAVPDGLCVDDDGCVWVALWGGGAVLRYTPSGVLDTRVELPVSLVTSCTFGDRNLATLFITTARRGLSAEALRLEPLAGAIFAVRPGVTGRAATPWAALALEDAPGRSTGQRMLGREVLPGKGSNSG